MATTVTYKDETIATVSNETKKLKTAGTWLEDDLTLTDVSGSAPILQDKTVTPNQSEQTIRADANATASDIASGKTAYVNGTKLTGTASGGGGGLNTKTGSFTIDADYKTLGNVELMPMSAIGFTPSQFYMTIDDISDVNGIQYAVLKASFETGKDGTYYRITMRYSNSTNSRGVTHNTASWTSNNNYMLYTDGTKIYFRTTTQYFLIKDVKYNWLAIE